MIEPLPRKQSSPVVKFFRALGFVIFGILGIVCAIYAVSEANLWLGLLAIALLLLAFLYRPNKTKETIVDSVIESVISAIFEFLITTLRLLSKVFE